MEPASALGLPSYRVIVALDIERSTSRPNPIKGELRNKTYELFEAALTNAGIDSCHYDRFIDRGDGILALIHPVDQAPKTLLLNRVFPLLSQLLTDYNASLPQHSQLQRQLRIRVVMHAGEVHYDANGCFGEALEIAFRLLDADRVKRLFREITDPLILVVSEDIHSSVVRHGYDGIDHETFHQLVRVRLAGRRYSGWIHLPGQGVRHTRHSDGRLPPPRLTGRNGGQAGGTGPSRPGRRGRLSEHAGLVVPGGLLDDDVHPVVRVDQGDQRHQRGELVIVVVLDGVRPEPRRRRRPRHRRCGCPAR